MSAQSTTASRYQGTSGAPAAVDNGEDPTLGPLTLPPPSLGTRIRFVDIPPETEEFLDHSRQCRSLSAAA